MHEVFFLTTEIIIFILGHFVLKIYIFAPEKNWS